MKVSLSEVIKKIILAFLVCAGLYFAKDFLMPLFIGGILATLFLPFCNWLERKKLSRTFAVFICLLGLLAFMAFVISLLGYQISELITDFASIKRKLNIIC